MKQSLILDAAVVDSSAIMSIFEGRSSAPAFRSGLARSRKLYMSAATLMELSVVFIGKKDIAGTAPLDAILSEFMIEVVDFDEPMVRVGRLACKSYGRGHNCSSNLNYGDLFSYALAKSKDLPLFFEGLGFSHTDLQDAMNILGFAFTDTHMPISLPV